MRFNMNDLVRVKLTPDTLSWLLQRPMMDHLVGHELQPDGTFTGALWKFIVYLGPRLTWQGAPQLIAWNELELVAHTAPALRTPAQENRDARINELLSELLGMWERGEGNKEREREIAREIRALK